TIALAQTRENLARCPPLAARRARLPSTWRALPASLPLPPPPAVHSSPDSAEPVPTDPHRREQPTHPEPAPHRAQRLQGGAAAETAPPPAPSPHSPPPGQAAASGATAPPTRAAAHSPAAHLPRSTSNTPARAAERAAPGPPEQTR